MRSEYMSLAAARAMSYRQRTYEAADVIYEEAPAHMRRARIKVQRPSIDAEFTQQELDWFAEGDRNTEMMTENRPPTLEEIQQPHRRRRWLSLIEQLTDAM